MNTKPPAAAGRRPAFLGPQHGAFRILVVDDEEDFRLSLCVLLEEAGYMASGAASATEALAALEEFPANLALADLVMPDMDGVHLMARIRDISPHTALLAITGASTADAAVDAMRHGVRHFLAKPFGKRELLQAVGGALEPACLRRERDQWKRTASLMLAGQTLLGLADADLAGQTAKMLLEHFGAEESALFAPAANGARPRLLAFSCDGGEAAGPSAPLAAVAESAQEKGTLQTQKPRRGRGPVQGCAMAAPLTAKGRLLGTLAVARCSPPFAESEAELLRAFAPQVAAAFDNATRRDEAQ